MFWEGFWFLYAKALLWHEEDFGHLTLETVNLFFLSFIVLNEDNWDIWN